MSSTTKNKATKKSVQKESKPSTKTKSQEKPNKSDKDPTKESTTVLENRTNQKQVLELDGEQIELKAYQKTKVNIDKTIAESVFANHINKNVIKIH